MVPPTSPGKGEARRRRGPDRGAAHPSLSPSPSASASLSAPPSAPPSAFPSASPSVPGAGTTGGDAVPDRTAEVLGRLARRVRTLRREQGRTARAVAVAAGLSPRFYAQLEAGEANIAIGRLAAVADALGVTLARLVEDRDPAVHLALLGLRGAGKSSVGPRLAGDLGLEFVELDAAVERRAGLWLPEIFALHGEIYYRRLETACLEDLLARDQPCVLALSGGIVHNPSAFELVRRGCVMIWLRARPEVHMQRVLDAGDHRPVAGRENAMAELRSLLASRRPLYRQAPISIDTSDRTLDAIVTELCTCLSIHGWRAPGPS